MDKVKEYNFTFTERSVNIIKDALQHYYNVDQQQIEYAKCVIYNMDSQIMEYNAVEQITNDYSIVDVKTSVDNDKVTRINSVIIKINTPNTDMLNHYAKACYFGYMHVKNKNGQDVPFRINNSSSSNETKLELDLMIPDERKEKVRYDGYIGQDENFDLRQFTISYKYIPR